MESASLQVGKGWERALTASGSQTSGQQSLADKLWAEARGPQDKRAHRHPWMGWWKQPTQGLTLCMPLACTERLGHPRGLGLSLVQVTG